MLVNSSEAQNSFLWNVEILLADTRAVLLLQRDEQKWGFMWAYKKWCLARPLTLQGLRGGVMTSAPMIVTFWAFLVLHLSWCTYVLQNSFKQQSPQREWHNCLCLCQSDRSQCLKKKSHYYKTIHQTFFELHSSLLYGSKVNFDHAFTVMDYLSVETSNFYSYCLQKNGNQQLPDSQEENDKKNQNLHIQTFKNCQNFKFWGFFF